MPEGANNNLKELWTKYQREKGTVEQKIAKIAKTI